MPIDRRVLLLLALVPGLAGCESTLSSVKAPDASGFGEPNRQTLAAQVIDPDPQYEYLDPATSGQHASAAIERYRQDKVKKPERVSSTASIGSGSGSGSGGK